MEGAEKLKAAVKPTKESKMIRMSTAAVCSSSHDAVPRWHVRLLRGSTTTVLHHSYTELTIYQTMRLSTSMPDTINYWGSTHEEKEGKYSPSRAGTKGEKRSRYSF